MATGFRLPSLHCPLTLSCSAVSHLNMNPRYEARVKIGRDTVMLRLLEHPGATCLLEYQVTQPDKVVLSQAMNLENGDMLAEFMAADPYGDRLRGQYYALAQVYSEATQSGRRAEETARADFGIEAWTNEADLSSRIRSVVKRFGGEDFLFRWLRLDDKTNDIVEHRSLLGCHPGWIHRYMHRLWYLNDPYVEYAKRHTLPATGSQLQVGGDDHWTRRDAIEYGFRHVALFPAHSRTGLIGMLQVTSAQASLVNAMLAGEMRMYLRQLVVELLDWRITKLRESAASRYGLDARDLSVLRTLKAGGTAPNVAASLGLSSRAVYGLFADINGKVGTAHITKAVAVAAASGLLD